MPWPAIVLGGIGWKLKGNDPRKEMTQRFEIRKDDICRYIIHVDMLIHNSSGILIYIKYLIPQRPTKTLSFRSWSLGCAQQYPGTAGIGSKGGRTGGWEMMGMQVRMQVFEVTQIDL